MTLPWCSEEMTLELGDIVDIPVGPFKWTSGEVIKVGGVFCAAVPFGKPFKLRTDADADGHTWYLRSKKMDGKS